MVNLLAIPTVIDISGTYVALVDIIVLAILLIAVIIGLSRGFLKQVLSLLGLVAGIVLAIIFCDDLVALVTEKVPAIPSALESAIASSSMFKDLTGSFTDKEQVLVSLQNSSIPAFLHETIANAIVSSGFELQIVKVFTTWALYVIVFIVTVLVSLLVFAILKKILYSLTKIRIIGFFDKILGMVLSVAVTLICIIIIVMLLSLFVDINAFIQPEGVKCYFNETMKIVLELDFIKNLLSGVIV